jgi:hypothetical protein
MVAQSCQRFPSGLLEIEPIYLRGVSFREDASYRDIKKRGGPNYQAEGLAYIGGERCRENWVHA